MGQVYVYNIVLVLYIVASFPSPRREESLGMRLSIQVPGAFCSCSILATTFIITPLSASIITLSVACRIVSSFILEQKSGGGEEGKLFNSIHSCWSGLLVFFFSECSVLQSVQESDLWSLEKMQAYFCHVKSLKSTMTEEANQYVH